MKEVWGSKLVTERLHRSVSDAISDLIHHTRTQVTPDDLKGRIFLMVRRPLINFLSVGSPSSLGRVVP